MNREEFLDLLRLYLNRFPKSMVDDIIRDYDEHFTIGIEKGKSETQIIEELGSPREIAREFEQGDFSRFEESDYDTEADDSDSPLAGVQERFKEFAAKPDHRRLLIMVGALILIAIVLPPIFSFIGSILGLVLIVFLAMFLGPTILGVGVGAIGALLIGSAIKGWSTAGFLFAGVSSITLILFGAGFLCLAGVLFSGAAAAVRYSWGLVQKAIYTIRWEITKRRRSE